MKIETKELELFGKRFDSFVKLKIVRGFCWTAINKTGKLGKQVVSNNWSRNKFVNKFIANGSLKSGYDKASRYIIQAKNGKPLRRAEFVNDGVMVNRIMIYNKRKAKTKRTKRSFYADTVLQRIAKQRVYDERTKRILEADLKKGISIAIPDAFKKIGGK